jgi:hypothetical protein
MAGEYAESLRGTGSGQQTYKPPVVKKKKKKVVEPTGPTGPTGPSTPTPVVETPTATTTADEPAPTNVVPAYEVFKAAFANLFDNVDSEDNWMRQMYAVAQGLYKKGFLTPDMPDQLLNDTSEATRLYRERFAGIFELKRRKAAGETVDFIPDVAQYNQMSKQMQSDLRGMGLNSIANNASIAKIIGADVDYTEFTKRIDNAFKAIDNADQWLKNELATNYGNLSREDLALGLLGGREGSDVLKKKIEVAGVRAGASQFGLQTQMDAAELAKKGVTQDIARAGYKKTSEQLAGYTQAAGMFGRQDVNLQAELEQQNVLGIESRAAKGLSSQARAQFGGQSGTTSGSLKRKAQV